MNKIKQVIIIRKDLKMRRGKEAAQVAHASMKVFFDMMEKLHVPVVIDNEIQKDFSSFISYTMLLCDNDPIIEWIDNSFTKIVLSCDSENELLMLQKQAEANDIIHALIKDNGETEFKEKCKNCKGKGTVTYAPPRGTTYSHSTETCFVCNGTGIINKPTYTALAIGPDYSDKIDIITKHLNLR